MKQNGNAEAIAAYYAGAADRAYPEAVLDAARMCLADWCAVGIGAFDQPAGEAVKSMSSSWATSGKAPMFFAGYHAPAAAALANGTYAHCLDFDDTHFGCLAHLSGPTWAATLATASHRGSNAMSTLRAFINGFEIAARLGGGELGQVVTKSGVHSTAVFGRLSATVASSHIYGLSDDQLINAMGIAATQCMGLVASFGTMSKPFHAGKAAMDGVISAEMAVRGFQAKTDLLEPNGQNLAAVLVQNKSATFPEIKFDDGWQILENTFKPYAACNLTHSTIETAQQLASKVKGRTIRNVIVDVHPTVLQFAGKPAPSTSLEGKFSDQYCAALGLCGYEAMKRDFEMDRISDPAIRAVMEKVQLRGDETVAQTAASMTVTFTEGDEVHANTPLASGNPGNPLGWDRMERKFFSLVEPALGPKARQLYELIRWFGDTEALPKVGEIISGRPVTH